ncbi:unnamed protein product [Blepharisma stoltei]|uniref:Trichocyst matrix protein n=1 Tax=Blepharisma stoltei TaxID=1481888 RepID=A0AAU9IC61_9CILI|nr:unnamed protein product [Blepharisma stoltei]
MSTKILFSLFTLLTVFSLETELTASDLLAEVDLDPMGNAILSTITLQLASGHDEGKIISVLEKVAGDLKKQQMTSSALNATQQKICDESVAAYSLQIQNTQSNIESSQQILNRDEPELENVIGQIAQKTKEITGFEEELKKAENQREADHNDWTSKDKESVEGIEAVMGGIKLTTQLKYEDANVVLIQQELTALKGRIEKEIEKTDKIMYKPVIASLAQIARSANLETVDEIIRILENLKIDLIASKGEDMKVEEQAQKVYEQYAATISSTISSSQQDIDSLRSKKERLEASVEAAESDIANSREKILNYKQMLDDQEKLCEQWKEIYLREDAEREMEIESIYKVVELVNNEILGVKAYLGQRNK